MTVQTNNMPAQIKRGRITRWGILRIALGVLLLAAAGLKMHGYVLDPVSQDSFLSSPRLQVAVIELEIILGLWLLSGWAARAAWLVALGFFGVLAAASFYMGWEGQSSCECFGRVHVSPWVTFSMDLVICAAIGFSRPIAVTASAAVKWIGDALRTVAAALVLVSLIGAMFFLFVERPLDTLARLRGDKITVSPNPVFAGEGRAGELIEFTVQVRNHTDHPVRLVGGTSDCSCSTTSELPIEIPPLEYWPLKVVIRLSRSPGIMHRSYELFTDEPGQFRVHGFFNARVDRSQKTGSVKTRRSVSDNNSSRTPTEFD